MTLCNPGTIQDLYVCVDTGSIFECVGAALPRSGDGRSPRMTPCSDANPCWQFSGSMTRAALFPQVQDYFIWLIILSVVCGVLLACLILTIIFLCSERKKVSNHEERLTNLEGGGVVAKPPGESVDEPKIMGPFGDGNNYDPYPPPKQVRASRIGGRARGDLILEDGEVKSRKSKLLDQDVIQKRISSNQALLMERAGINMGRLSGSNTADMRLQDTIMNDPYADDNDAPPPAMKLGPQRKEKEFFYGNETERDHTMNATMDFNPYGEEEDEDEVVGQNDEEVVLGGFEEQVRAELSRTKQPEKHKEEAMKSNALSAKPRRESRAAGRKADGSAVLFDPYAEKEMSSDDAMNQAAPQPGIAKKAPTEDRFATMLKTDLSKVRKRQDPQISAPVVQAAESAGGAGSVAGKSTGSAGRGPRLTGAALEQLERDKRTMLAGISAEDIERRGPEEGSWGRASETKKGVGLRRQLSKGKLATADTLYNDPYAE